jgi:hypothetical protein
MTVHALSVRNIRQRKSWTANAVFACLLRYRKGLPLSTHSFHYLSSEGYVSIFHLMIKQVDLWKHENFSGRFSLYLNFAVRCHYPHGKVQERSIRSNWWYEE